MRGGKEFSEGLADEMSRIGAEMIRWRRQQGLTQAEAAARAGVHLSTWAQLETSPRGKPTANTVRKVAVTIGLPVVNALRALGYAVTAEDLVVAVAHDLDAIAEDVARIERRLSLTRWHLRGNNHAVQQSGPTPDEPK